MDEAAAHAWMPRENEPSRWYERFLIYLRLGPDRSLHAAYVEYRKARESARKRAKTVRERYGVPRSWKTGFERFSWAERATAKDKAERAEVDAAYEKRRKEILESGYALAFERVAKLDELATLLWDELTTDTKRWLADAKGIGSGDTFKRVNIVRFNAPLIEQFRATIADIAIEKGERKQGVLVSGNLGLTATLTADDMAKAQAAAELAEKELSESM